MSKTYCGLSPDIIIHEAARLFFQKGYKNTSLEEVANILQVTRPAIYHYFKSKEKIMVAIQKEVSNKVMTYSGEVLALNLPADQKFERMVYYHALLILENRIEMGIVFEELKNLPSHLAEEVLTVIDQYYKNMNILYQASVNSGHFIDVDPSIAVQVTLGACNWAYKWFSPDGTFTKEQVAELISQMLVQGYRQYPHSAEINPI